MIDRITYLPDPVAVLHQLRTRKGFHPYTAHFRFHLAIAVAAHAAAGPVAQGFRTVHRADHAGRTERTEPAHLGIEKKALDHFFDSGRRPFEAPVADLLKQRMQEQEHGLEAVIEALEKPGMPGRPATNLVNSLSPNAGWRPQLPYSVRAFTTVIALLRYLDLTTNGILR